MSDRTNDAGDLTRALFDKPVTAIAEAIRENSEPTKVANLVGLLAAGLSEQHRRALAGLAGGTPAPTPATTPDLRDALADDGCTVTTLAEAIGATFTVEARSSLLAALADELPAERLAPLAHRLTVRVRNTGDLIEPEPIAESTLAGLDTDERRVAAALELLKRCGSKTVQAVEMKLPMLRKEIGARERAAAANGSR